MEAIVVDDGSSDRAVLQQIIAGREEIRLIEHESNRGMCAARNSGIAEAAGDLIVILDADDELVSNWPAVLTEILEQWPAECQLCYAACQNQLGIVTASEPDYQGFLTLDDILNERHSGEYLPIFRGSYVRRKPYVDLGMRKSCGIVSYINFAQDGPFWISSKVLRIYHELQEGSVTSGWASAAKAAETARCYAELFERYGDLYKTCAPEVYRSKLLRLAVYLRLAGLSGAWRAFREGASVHVLKETAGTAFMLLAGARIAGRVIPFLKSVGAVRRYG